MNFLKSSGKPSKKKRRLFNVSKQKVDIDKIKLELAIIITLNNSK